MAHPQDAFLVSEETVTLARACRKALPEEELPMLDLSSRKAPSDPETFDVEIAREAIGERLLGAIGTMGRWARTLDPTCDRIPITSCQNEHRPIVDEIRERVADNLGLDPEHPAFPTFLAHLTSDLRSWLMQQPELATEYGLQEEADGTVTCSTPDLSPVLEPLEE